MAVKPSNTPKSDADFLRRIAADYEYADNIPKPIYDRLHKIADTLSSENAAPQVEQADVAAEKSTGRSTPGVAAPFDKHGEAAEYQLAQRVLKAWEACPVDDNGFGETVILARAYMAMVEAAQSATTERERALEERLRICEDTLMVYASHNRHGPQSAQKALDMLKRAAVDEARRLYVLHDSQENGNG